MKFMCVIRSKHASIIYLLSLGSTTTITDTENEMKTMKRKYEEKAMGRLKPAFEIIALIIFASIGMLFCIYSKVFKREDKIKTNNSTE